LESIPRERTSSSEHLGPIWIEGGGRGSRVELDENRLILGQFLSTLLYSPFLPLNPNGPE